MKKAAIITGIISTTMIILGSLFKIQHWPGAGPLVVFGMMIHVIGFLPLWMIFRLKESQGGLSKAVVIVGFVVLFAFFISILFRTQHWPGGGPFMALSIFLAVFVFLPLLLINFKKERERNIWFLPTLFIVAPLIMLPLARNVSRASLDSYISIEHSLKNIPSQLAKSSEAGYAAMDSLKRVDPEGVEHYYEKALVLRKNSKELVAYIRAIRARLISMTMKIPHEAADTLPLTYVYAKDNIDIPTWVLIGSDPSNPQDGEFTAKELKNRLDAYKTSITNLVGEGALTADDLGLSTDPVEMASYGPKESWETSRFYNVPLGAAINVLEAIEVEVRSAELAALNEIALQATKDSRPE